MSNKGSNYIQVYFKTEDKETVVELIEAISNSTKKSKNGVMKEALLTGLHLILDRELAKKGGKK